MKRCVIFSAGTYCGLRGEISDEDLILAADAGFRYCMAEQIAPELVIGDFDSMEEPSDQNTARVPVEKDDTDTMLALKTGLNHGCREFHIYGGTGGKRPDHTVANLQGLLFLAEHGAHGFLYDENFVFTAIRQESMIVKRPVNWGVLSVFCLGEPAQGVSLEGLQYPLKNGELHPAFPLGVSNHFTAEEAVISVGTGSLLVGWELPEGREPINCRFE